MKNIYCLFLILGAVWCHNETPENSQLLKPLRRTLRNVLNQQDSFGGLNPDSLNRLDATSSSDFYNRNRRPINSQEAIDAALEQVLPILQPTCIKNGGVHALNEFKKAFRKVANNTLALQNRLSQKMEGTEGVPISYLCNEYRNGIRSNLDELAVKAAACLDNDEAYFPKFLTDAYNSVSEYLCKDDGKAPKQILQIINNPPNQCLKNIAGGESPQNCFEKTKYLQAYVDKDESITKDKLCVDMKIMKDCAMHIFDTKCSKGDETYQLAKGLTDAVYAPCSGCSLLIFNVLIALLLIISGII